jgi:hypothetical protein
MGRLTGYKVVSNTNLEHFMRDVNALPIGRWRPAGSLATSVIKIYDDYAKQYDEYVVYSQAFIEDLQ